jgi:uncharacterized protein YprB with RNaseH-like and TPR domain
MAHKIFHSKRKFDLNDLDLKHIKKKWLCYVKENEVIPLVHYMEEHYFNMEDFQKISKKKILSYEDAEDLDRYLHNHSVYHGISKPRDPFIF